MALQPGRCICVVLHEGLSAFCGKRSASVSRLFDHIGQAEQLADTSRDIGDKRFTIRYARCFMRRISSATRRFFSWRVPQLHCSIGTRRGDAVSIRAECDTHNRCCVSFERERFLSCGTVPELERLIPAR